MSHRTPQTCGVVTVSMVLYNVKTVGLKWKGLAHVKHKQGGGEEQECVDDEHQMRLKT